MNITRYYGFFWNFFRIIAFYKNWLIFSLFITNSISISVQFSTRLLIYISSFFFTMEIPFLESSILWLLFGLVTLQASCITVILGLIFVIILGIPIAFLPNLVLHFQNSVFFSFFACSDVFGGAYSEVGMWGNYFWTSWFWKCLNFILSFIWLVFGWI